MKINEKLDSQFAAVLYFIQQLDIDMIDTLLDEERTYQDYEKSIFIKKLSVAFDEFIAAGDTFLKYTNGFCRSEYCNFKCKGYRFIGNNSNAYFDLIIEVGDGIVFDIYECSFFNSDQSIIPQSKHILIDKPI